MAMRVSFANFFFSSTRFGVTLFFSSYGLRAFFFLSLRSEDRSLVSLRLRLERLSLELLLLPLSESVGWLGDELLLLLLECESSSERLE